MANERKPVSDLRDPSAQRYAQEIEARNQERKRRGASVPMPRLDTPPPPEGVSGVTGADIARMQRAQAAAPQIGLMPSQVAPPAPALSYLRGPEAAPPPPPPPSPMQGGFHVLAGDLLPEAARRDPMFRPGVGDIFAINQDASLIEKYGVLRKGQLVRPSLEPQPGKQGMLSQKTMEGLTALAGATGGSAAAVPPKPKEKEYQDPLDSTSIERGLDRLDKIFGLEEAVKEDVLNNEEQRKLIEARLQPLSLAELLMTGKVRQTVPIVPGVFEATFESFSLGADLELEDIMAELEVQRAKEKKPVFGLQRRKFALSLTMTVMAMRAGDAVHMFGSIYNDKNEVDSVKFWDKFTQIAKLNTHTYSSLMTNAMWFDLRVRRLHLAVGPS